MVVTTAVYDNPFPILPVCCSVPVYWAGAMPAFLGAHVDRIQPDTRCRKEDHVRAACRVADTVVEQQPQQAGRQSRKD